MATIRDTELEYEDELEDELGFGEGEMEEEGIFGAIAQGIGSLLGEGEEEYEGEEELHEHELQEHGFGEGEDEAGFGESAFHEYEFEDESGEMFLGRLRGLGNALRGIARIAAPTVLRAVGGPLGGVLANVAGQVLREGEFEDELSHEYEFEDELEGEATHEYETAMAQQMSQTEALAELMASVAAGAQTEAEAEAMIGAATVTVLSARERRELRRVLAHLVRGSAILTRLLRRRRITRPAVRAVPLIVHQTARTLSRRAASGQPITRRAAARTMAAHTRRVLSNPRVCTRAIHRNVQASRTAQRVIVRPAVRPSARPTARRRPY